MCILSGPPFLSGQDFNDMEEARYLISTCIANVNLKVAVAACIDKQFI